MNIPSPKDAYEAKQEMILQVANNSFAQLDEYFKTHPPKLTDECNYFIENVDHLDDLLREVYGIIGVDYKDNMFNERECLQLYVSSKFNDKTFQYEVKIRFKTRTEYGYELSPIKVIE